MPPSDVEYRTSLPGSALRNRGCGWVLNGEWDALGHPFAKDLRYRAVRDVVASGSRWQETEEYASALDSLEKGLPVRHCWTREDLDRRCDVLDGLIETIRREGYLTQAELRRRRTGEAQLGRQDEISVAIGRYGDVLFRDGAHRLAIAKLVGVPFIPVEVELRHSGWMEFRARIERYANAHGGRVPQPLLHPDLNDIPAAQSCETRYRSLIESLPTRCTVLDLAPGWGYFCQRLEGEGFVCTAVEPFSDAAGFLATLRRAGNRTFAILSRDGLDTLPHGGGAFDAGLLLSDGLSVSSQPSQTDLLVTLSSLKVRQLFVEPEGVIGRAVAACDDKPNCDRFLEALSDATGLHARSCLGWNAESGPLYRLH